MLRRGVGLRSTFRAKGQAQLLRWPASSAVAALNSHFTLLFLRWWYCSAETTRENRRHRLAVTANVDN
jgi:hypothetical protein